MRKIKILLTALFSLALGFLIAQNTHVIEVNFLWYSVEVPAIMPFLLSAGVAFLMGAIMVVSLRSKSKSKNVQVPVPGPEQSFRGDPYA